ncbi:MAG: hypothetical protein WAM71_07550 [Candidatus Korobacteraceae bacterium]
MINQVPPRATPQPAPQPAAVRNENNTQPPQPPTPKPAAVVKADSIQISAAAQAMQEMTETAAQTTKEAAGGDVQAKHLLAKEAAEKAAG